MISLLATLGGFLTSLIPEIVKLFKEIKDKKHEIELLNKQIELANITGKFEAEIAKEKSEEIEEKQMINMHFTTPFIEALNSSVRPVLAYMFFALYAFIKFIRFKSFECEIAIPLSIRLDMLWNIEDQGIFAGIIGFYFGQKAIRNIYKK